jgi:hypothetical protein
MPQHNMKQNKHSMHLRTTAKIPEDKKLDFSLAKQQYANLVIYISKSYPFRYFG